MSKEEIIFYLKIGYSFGLSDAQSVAYKNDAYNTAMQLMELQVNSDKRINDVVSTPIKIEESQSVNR